MKHWLEQLREACMIPDVGARPLLALGRLGAFVLFRRGDGIFHAAEKGGYAVDGSYSFLGDSPDLWAGALEKGCIRVPDSCALRPGAGVFVAVDKSEPELLLVAEIPGADDAAIPLVFFLVQLEAGRAAAVVLDLPVWLSEMLPAVAEKPSPLLVVAEPGSGRDEFVLALISRRFGSPDAAAFFHPGRLSEAVQLREIFGDAAGARLGTSVAVPMVLRPGRAIVIREAGDLEPLVQLRILSYLIGGEGARKFWIFQTSRDLQSMVSAGKFEPGLLSLLDKGRIVLPPVRTGRGRLLEEIQRLIRSFRARYGRDVDLSPSAVDVLLDHDWPGNWTELRSVIESAFLLCPGAIIEPEGLRLFRGSADAPDMPDEADDLNLRRAARDRERDLLLRAYALHGGNQVQMARALGISRGSLQYKLRKFQILADEEGRG